MAHRQSDDPASKPDLPGTSGSRDWIQDSPFLMKPKAGPSQFRGHRWPKGGTWKAEETHNMDTWPSRGAECVPLPESATSIYCFPLTPNYTNFYFVFMAKLCIKNHSLVTWGDSSAKKSMNQVQSPLPPSDDSQTL